MFAKVRKRIKNIDGFTSNDTKAVWCYELGTLHDFRNKLIDKLKIPSDFFTDGEADDENVTAIIKDISFSLAIGYDTKEQIIELLETEFYSTREEIIKVLDDYGGDKAKVRKEWEIDGSNPPIYNFVKQ